MSDGTKRLVGWAVVVAAIVAAAFLGVDYPVPPPPAPEPEPGLGALDGVITLGEETRGFRPVQVRALRVLQDLAVDNDATITGDAAVGGAVDVTGALTVGELTVTGGITGTNVLTSGDQSIAGIKTFTTPAVLSGGVTGPLALTGPTAVATATPAVVINNTGAGNVAFEVRDSATPVFQVRNGGAVAAQSIYSLAPVLAKTESYGATAADTGAIIKASGAITITLPAAAVGLNYCVVNFTGDDQVIAFTDATDVALNEVNSPGDRVTNTTVYDNICLAAIDATNWVTISSIGTWADGN